MGKKHSKLKKNEEGVAESGSKHEHQHSKNDKDKGQTRTKGSSKSDKKGKSKQEPSKNNNNNNETGAKKSKASHPPKKKEKKAAASKDKSKDKPESSSKRKSSKKPKKSVKPTPKPGKSKKKEVKAASPTQSSVETSTPIAPQTDHQPTNPTGEKPVKSKKKCCKKCCSCCCKKKKKEPQQPINAKSGPSAMIKRPPSPQRPIICDDPTVTDKSKYLCPVQWIVLVIAISMLLILMFVECPGRNGLAGPNFIPVILTIAFVGTDVLFILMFILLTMWAGKNRTCRIGKEIMLAGHLIFGAVVSLEDYRFYDKYSLSEKHNGTEANCVKTCLSTSLVILVLGIIPYIIFVQKFRAYHPNFRRQRLRRQRTLYSNSQVYPFATVYESRSRLKTSEDTSSSSDFYPVFVNVYA